MLDVVFSKWGSDVITGDRNPDKPSMLAFKHSEKALRILEKHIRKNSLIGVHADVDMDGIGSVYILKQFIESLSSNRHLFIINKDKDHGIKDKHVEYFNAINKIDLLIVLDSSSNDIDLIKELSCDVIVIDHHEIHHEDLYGVREDGTEYVIINNMIENKDVKVINEFINVNNLEANLSIGEYSVDSRMSCGLVLYELLRLYSVAYQTGPILENKMLYQWVGVTLFTDAIILNTERNQWYIDNTVHSMDVEPCLNIILKQLNKYKAKIDKSFINYTLAPRINKAIRAGATSQALDIILNNPYKIRDLEIYGDDQAKALELVIGDVDKSNDSYIAKDVTSLGISKNYCGVIAGRLCGENSKNTIVYLVEDGVAKGSFRGRYNVDYRGKFEQFKEGIYAQGHKGAFGFKVQVELIDSLMESLKEIEPIGNIREYLTAGEIREELRGIHHIENIDEFRVGGNLWRLAIGNSKLSSSEEINIVTSLNEAILKDTRGKLFIYNVLGIECKAFEELASNRIKIYAEYSTSIDFYVKNY